MKEKNFGLSAKRIARRFRDATASAFDYGISMKIAAEVRRRFMGLNLRCAGVFIFTFGIYSALTVLVKHFFWEIDPVMGMTISLLAALSAIPLMLSHHTLGESLHKTRTGNTILSLIGIREESVRQVEPFGRSNAAFICGVVIGTLTFFFTPGDMLLFLTALVLGGVILTVPESSVIFAAAILPLGLERLCLVLSVLGIVSFALKYLRYKRTIENTLHDKAAGVMLVLLLLGALVCVHGGGGFSFVSLMMSYFIVSFSPSASSLGDRLVSVLVASGGLSSAVFIGFALADFALSDGKRAFAESMESIAVYDTSVVSVVLVALIPVAVSLLLSGGALARSTSLLSTASMIAFLVLEGGYIYLVSALVGVVFAIMFYNRRVAYLMIALAFAAAVVLAWTGGGEGSVEAFANLLGRTEGGDTSYQYFMFGEGLSRGFGRGGSFYTVLMSRLGFVGVAVVLAFSVLVSGELIGLAKKCRILGINIYKKACIPLGGLIALAVCGIRVNIWECHEGFMLFWLLSGSFSAYLAGESAVADKLLEGRREEKSRNAAGITIK